MSFSQIKATCLCSWKISHSIMKQNVCGFWSELANTRYTVTSEGRFSSLWQFVRSIICRLSWIMKSAWIAKLLDHKVQYFTWLADSQKLDLHAHLLPPITFVLSKTLVQDNHLQISSSWFQASPSCSLSANNIWFAPRQPKADLHWCLNNWNSLQSLTLRKIQRNQQSNSKAFAHVGQKWSLTNNQNNIYILVNLISLIMYIFVHAKPYKS
jgi:hypothetical protein